MKIYDISLPLSTKDMVFPGTPKMNYSLTHNIKNDKYNLSLVTLNSHAGTHTDAPSHFIENGYTLDQVDLNKYVGKAIVLDCITKKDFEQICVEDAKPYKEKIENYKRVIFKTGWSKFFNTPKYFTDYPIITFELAEWLVQRGVVMVGVESPSLNPALYIEVHKMLLGNGVAIIEGLANLESLPSEEIFFVGAPIALKGGDGFPIRAVAILNCL